MNKDFKDDSSQWLGLSTRAINALTRENQFQSKEQISLYLSEDRHLDHLPFIGPKTRDEILNWLGKESS